LTICLTAVVTITRGRGFCERSIEPQLWASKPGSHDSPDTMSVISYIRLAFRVEWWQSWIVFMSYMRWNMYYVQDT